MLHGAADFAVSRIDDRDWVPMARHFAQLLFSPGGERFLENQGESFIEVTRAYRAHYVEGAEAFENTTLGRR